MKEISVPRVNLKSLETNFENIRIRNLKTELKFGPIGFHNPNILATGVSAVGKDHWLDNVTKQIDIPAISVGTVLADQIGIDRDKIREMDYVEYFEEKRKAAEYIIRQGKSFVNSHLVTRHRGALVVDGVFERIINPTYFVVIVGDPKEIMLRREQRNEKGRKSDIEDEDTIMYHQILTLKATQALAIALKSGFAVVVNNFDDSKKNTNLGLQLAKSL